MYITTYYDVANDKSKNIYLEFIKYIRDKLLQCLEKLQFSYEFDEDNFKLIALEEVIQLEDADESFYETSFNLKDDFLNCEEVTRETNDKMTDEQKAKFINTYSKMIPEYDGRFENLQKFIDACELMDEGAKNFMATAVKLIKAKLGITPRSHITNEDTIVKIIATLKENIKADS